MGDTGDSPRDRKNRSEEQERVTEEEPQKFPLPDGFSEKPGWREQRQQRPDRSDVEYEIFPDLVFRKEEKRLYTILRDSDGKDRVTIYIENPKSMKKLPPNMGVRADTVLLQELGTVFGEDNVKVV